MLIAPINLVSCRWRDNIKKGVSEEHQNASTIDRQIDSEIPPTYAKLINTISNKQERKIDWSSEYIDNPSNNMKSFAIIAHILTLLLLPMSGHGLSLQYHEISQSKYCDSTPPSVVKACKEHKGSRSPFRYVAIHSFDECQAIADSAINSECRLKPFGSIYYVQTSSLIENIDLSRDSIEMQAANRKYARSAGLIAAPYIALVAGGILVISFLYWVSDGHANLNPLNN